jgi:hypothetical protein
MVRCWIDNVRDSIASKATQLKRLPRDFAATLVAAIVSSTYLVQAHIGDGACVLRASESSDYVVPSWPSHGQYASTTYFLTDDPQPRLNFVTLEGAFDCVAVFSDGIEHLVLQMDIQTAHMPFFNSMFAPLARASAGRDRRLSNELRQFLSSDLVTAKTDDDKTILLARRLPTNI